MRRRKGTARILGHDVQTEQRAIRALVGYMPENDAFIAGMTAVRLVRLMAELSGLPPREALERAHEALFYVGLGEARYRRVETYSLGMKQMAKLAQAIVHGPRLLFLDEPTNGLDPPHRRRMLQLIREIRDRGDVHVMLSSHLLRDVEECCDEVLILQGGRDRHVLRPRGRAAGQPEVHRGRDERRQRRVRRGDRPAGLRVRPARREQAQDGPARGRRDPRPVPDRRRARACRSGAWTTSATRCRTSSCKRDGGRPWRSMSARTAATRARSRRCAGASSSSRATPSTRCSARSCSSRSASSVCCARSACLHPVPAPQPGVPQAVQRRRGDGVADLLLRCEVLLRVADDPADDDGVRRDVRHRPGPGLGRPAQQRPARSTSPARSPAPSTCWARSRSWSCCCPRSPGSRACSLFVLQAYLEGTDWLGAKLARRCRDLSWARGSGSCCSAWSASRCRPTSSGSPWRG